MNRDNTLHQIRPRLRRYPREDGAIAVRDQDRRPDPIQKQCPARAPDVLSNGVVAHRLAHRRRELHDGGIVRRAAPRPLSAGNACRRLFEGRRLRVEVAVHKRLIRTSALPRPIDDVNLITLFQQKRGPSPAPIGRAEPVRALSVAAVDQDHRIRMPHGDRNPVLHIHLHAVAHRPAGEQGMLHPVPEVTPLRNIENRTRSIRRRLRASVPWQRGQRACRKNSQFPASQHDKDLITFPATRITARLPRDTDMRSRLW